MVFQCAARHFSNECMYPNYREQAEYPGPGKRQVCHEHINTPVDELLGINHWEMHRELPAALLRITNDQQRTMSMDYLFWKDQRASFARPSH